ncbi:hypothetical protein BGW38_006353, partial [Lunasporangiospora selenospora]
LSGHGLAKDGNGQQAVESALTSGVNKKYRRNSPKTTPIASQRRGAYSMTGKNEG